MTSRVKVQDNILSSKTADESNNCSNFEMDENSIEDDYGYDDVKQENSDNNQDDNSDNCSSEDKSPESSEDDDDFHPTKKTKSSVW